MLVSSHYRTAHGIISELSSRFFFGEGKATFQARNVIILLSRGIFIIVLLVLWITPISFRGLHGFGQQIVKIVKILVIVVVLSHVDDNLVAIGIVQRFSYVRVPVNSGTTLSCCLVEQANFFLELRRKHRAWQV
jgi:hypothetical protein